ncbi:MAG: sigma-54-dependent Fis family transcriptional regulator [Candidatus Abyssobacteria bacterium SURF_5]|uniref:Sigma-54-dependent Fis family transcriptional regulator n=1 Tax=Abyssobacteria bacterium (strain SURF_5) TaxID=2093360 RepID=A0A3A4NLF0_ABYX5|nr:MAG: sigma-54-dependent Fis family transcriptional regulator [Candidatus Abyssubacteria bacterium SURF_5]
MEKARILIVEDEASMRELLAIMLERHGYKVEGVESYDEAAAKLRKGPWDLVITDLWLHEDRQGGIKVLQEAQQANGFISSIVITAHSSVDSAVEAMKLGAYDYLIKPFKNDELRMVVEKALESKHLRAENSILKSELKKHSRLDDLVGNSPGMINMKNLIRKVAGLSSTVLILGESGTGKELVAKAIHHCSPRDERPFVAINCGGIPESLLESELFGHVKGAFTGAISHKDGLFKVANGGTLFLDEIGETSMALQVKLLRVLDEMKIRPVGSSVDFSVDVRLISATNKDLEKLVAEGNFREDFYYRLNVIPIYVPLLRERREDILLLARYFLDSFFRRSGKMLQLSNEAERILEKYHWPGNVRELENVIERAAALCDGNRIEPDDLPVKVCCSGEEEPQVAEFPPEGIDLTTRVEAFERSLIKQALRKASNSQTRAAGLLRLSPRSLRYKLEKFNMKAREN